MIKNILLLSLYFSILSAQGLYTYKLFNNKFQAMFPAEPTRYSSGNVMSKEEFIRSLPTEYKNQLTNQQLEQIYQTAIESSYYYMYLDRPNAVTYTCSTAFSGLTHQNYIWQGMKALLDKSIADTLKSVNNPRVFKFNSTLDKKNDKYIAIYSYSFDQDGITMYQNVKQIYYKDKMYRWSIGSPNNTGKMIFEKNQKYADLLK